MKRGEYSFNKFAIIVPKQYSKFEDIPDEFIFKLKKLGNCFPLTQSSMEQNIFINFLRDDKAVFQLLETIYGSYGNINKFCYRYINNSQNKELSKYFETYLYNGNINVMSFINKFYLQATLNDFNVIGAYLNKFYDKWSRLWDLYNSKYDALSPYDMNISENLTGKLDSTDKGSKTNTGSNSSNTINKTLANDTDDSIYGFNSSTAVPTDKSHNTSEDNSTKTGSTTNNQNSTSEYTRNNNEDRTVIRKGNIGNITKQELILKEREILQYQIEDVIFRDLDTIFTNGKYL